MERRLPAVQCLQIHLVAFHRWVVLLKLNQREVAVSMVQQLKHKRDQLSKAKVKDLEENDFQIELKFLG